VSVLVLGATGMAGRAFCRSLDSKAYQVTGVARTGSDIDADISDESSLLSVLSSGSFDAIINAAALVDIAACNEDPLAGWMINTAPLATLANWSQEFDIPLLHISTDHYYPYGDDSAHSEEDPVFFLNGYARQKYAAEALALASSNALVLRTSILGQQGPGGKGLVQWATGALLEGKELTVFCDSWTSSLEVHSFANSACTLFFDQCVRGLLNLASSEVYSKEALIRELANRLDVPQSNLVSASIKKILPNRPHCLGLDVSKTERLLGHSLPNMIETIDQLMEKSIFSKKDYAVH